MAKQVRVVVLDDLDGSEATETVSFGLDGVSYEIDLSTDNAERLRTALAAYTQVARRSAAVAAARGGTATRTAPARVDMSSVRSWAREQGFDISDRGRIPRTVLEGYRAAHA